MHRDPTAECALWNCEKRVPRLKRRVSREQLQGARVLQEQLGTEKENMQKLAEDFRRAVKEL